MLIWTKLKVIWVNSRDWTNLRLILGSNGITRGSNGLTGDSDSLTKGSNGLTGGSKGLF